MFVTLLLLGLGNFLVVERLRQNPATSTLRLRRLRRSRDRHRHHDFLRSRLAHQRAAGHRPHPGPRHLARDRRAQPAGMAAPHLARPRHARTARVASPARPRSRRATAPRCRSLHPGLRRAARAQRRGHRLVGIQPPLGRHLRRRRRPPRADAPGRGALGQALAARLPRNGGVPVHPLRPRGLAARPHRLLRELPRRRGPAASHLRAPSGRLRPCSSGASAPAI